MIDLTFYHKTCITNWRCGIWNMWAFNRQGSPIDNSVCIMESAASRIFSDYRGKRQFFELIICWCYLWDCFQVIPHSCLSVVYINTFQKLWRHTCETWCVFRFGFDPPYNCKHQKSVQFSRGQMEEGISLCLCFIFLNLYAVLECYRQVGEGRLIITVIEPRQPDGCFVHFTHTEVGHCIGHCSKYSRGLCKAKNLNRKWYLIFWWFVDLCM